MSLIHSEGPAIQPPSEESLLERFGVPSLFSWQREAVDELLEGSGSVLVVAPTGGGKSLCYQYPAVALGGTSLVISPLIALMEDQVRALEERGIPATYLASTVEPEERRRRALGIAQGHYRLVYVAPERLHKPALIELLRQLRPPLVAIDEAHCISHWGHDFRPDYLRLGELLETLSPPRVLACTATATSEVREEIMSRLRLVQRGAKVLLRGFARPNLHLEVQEVDRLARRQTIALERVRAALGFVKEPSGSAIVYAGTRRLSQRLAEAFCEHGWRCQAYHAGLDAALREQVNASFAAGQLDVVVATNAFGMGIDRADIRIVVHVQAPGSIAQYYQEVGRAGRDGQPACGLLLSGMSDFGLRRRLIDMDRDGTEPVPGSAAAVWKQRQWQQFLDLMRYVEAGSCRHDFILRHFGDEGELLGGCGHCDICERIDEYGERAGVSEADSLVVRKALSGVARLRGRAGMTLLAASLRGANQQRVQQLGLHHLSTHGLLAGQSQEWVMGLLRRLLTAKLIDLSVGDYPVPLLTAEGWATMKGECEVRVLPPDNAQSKRAAEAKAKKRPLGHLSLDDGQAEVFERLREARLELAHARSVPAYVICHDRTLRELAILQPCDIAGLSEAHGMGPGRIESYGERFLAVLLEARQSASSS